MATFNYAGLKTALRVVLSVINGQIGAIKRSVQIVKQCLKQRTDTYVALDMVDVDELQELL